MRALNKFSCIPKNSCYIPCTTRRERVPHHGVRAFTQGPHHQHRRRYAALSVRFRGHFTGPPHPLRNHPQRRRKRTFPPYDHQTYGWSSAKNANDFQSRTSRFPHKTLSKLLQKTLPCSALKAAPLKICERRSIDHKIPLISAISTKKLRIHSLSPYPPSTSLPIRSIALNRGT